MITQRVEGLSYIHFLFQLFLIVLFYWAYVLFFVAHYDFQTHPFLAIEHYSLYCVLITCSLIMHRLWSNHSELDLLRGGLQACHQTSFRQTLFSGALLAFYLVATKDITISRLFLFSLLPMMYLIFFITNRLLPLPLAKKVFRTVKEPTLLIGSNVRATSLKPWLNRAELLGIQISGLLTDEQEKGDNILDVPVIGKVSDFEKILEENHVTNVILLDFPYRPTLTTHLVHTCSKFGVRPLVLDNLQETFRRPTTYFEDDGMRFISLRAEPLENPWNRTLKRLIDVLVALPVIVFVLPIASAIVWFFQRIQSPGPLFYSQPRAGLQNREFMIYKFRTMHCNHGLVARQATQNDDRIYPAGRWFRKLSIDELPQFLNVLKGEMSVVGPRPHLIEHNEQFARIMDGYRIRSYIKPGITGMAQIQGFRGETRTEEDIIRRVEWDIYYLENWSPSLDLEIIFKTFWHVVTPPQTAY